MFPKVGSVIKVFLLISLCCISYSSSEKEIPETKHFSKHVGTATMSFQYCYSCGYKKAFEEYVSIINERYPNILINGANYDPPGINYILNKFIFVVKMVLILVLVSSYDIWNVFGRAIPRWYTWCTENKIYACMMIFFLGNVFEAQLISSGAFEISFNDIPIWSKLETGRIPSPQELFQIIESHTRFSDQETYSN